MTLEQIYYIGQTIAVFAILGTLVYVAIQTRQSTAATQASTRQAILESDQQFIVYLLEHPELETLRFKQGLSEVERIQLGLLFTMFARIRENHWLQYKSGVLDACTWNSYERSIVLVLGGANGRAFWKNYAEANAVFNAAFSSLVSKLLANEPVHEQSRLTALFD